VRDQLLNSNPNQHRKRFLFARLFKIGQNVSSALQHLP
jgi:hypothetical protein